jgi:hypothetical protein
MSSDVVRSDLRSYSPDLAPAGARSGEYGRLLSVSPPERHHERGTFCRRGGNPRTCDSGSAFGVVSSDEVHAPRH